MSLELTSGLKWHFVVQAFILLDDVDDVIIESSLTPTTTTVTTTITSTPCLPGQVMWKFDRNFLDACGIFNGVPTTYPNFVSPGIDGDGTCFYLNARARQSVTVRSPPFLNMVLQVVHRQRLDQPSFMEQREQFGQRDFRSERSTDVLSFASLGSSQWFPTHGIFRRRYHRLNNCPNQSLDARENIFVSLFLHRFVFSVGLCL